MTKPMTARYELHNADCLEWMAAQKPNTVHAIVTDPPYGFREYTDVEKEKLRKGRGGVWRIPPSFVLDPFAGGGSTLAAAVAVGYQSIELDPAYYEATKAAIPKLAAFSTPSYPGAL